METTYVERIKSKRVKKIVFGILVVLAGATLMAFNLGHFPIEYKEIVFSWQSLIIAIGFISLFGKDSWIMGIIMMAIGGFYLASKLHNLPFDMDAVFWPSIVILAGIVIILKRTLKHKHCHQRWEKCNPGKVDTFVLEEGMINESNVFGGSKRIISEENFRGGRIENVFGGTEIDLRNSKLAEGISTLEVSCVFGGMSLIVPSDWHVQIEMQSVMGGFVDKRRIIQPDLSTSTKLIIKGSCVFGGGDIKSY
jgi:predicted membrane protein